MTRLWLDSSSTAARTTFCMRYVDACFRCGACSLDLHCSHATSMTLQLDEQVSTVPDSAGFLKRLLSHCLVLAKRQYNAFVVRVEKHCMLASSSICTCCAERASHGHQRGQVQAQPSCWHCTLHPRVGGRRPLWSRALQPCTMALHHGAMALLRVRHM